MDEYVLDMLVVGAGPAGGMAALEAVRRGMSVIVVSDAPTGGLVRAARRIDNLPGWPEGARAARWVESFCSQMAARGITPVNDHVRRIDLAEGVFTISARERRFRAWTVVVAAGTRPIPFRPALPESPRFHRDVARLPIDMRGTCVAVIGSGEAALDSALNLMDRGADVTVFARGDKLHACPALMTEFGASDAALATGARILSIRTTPQTIVLEFQDFPEWLGDHVVAAIGRESRMDEIDLACGPDTPGLWFAGDMLRDRERYIAMALGDGQRAACLAHAHITGRNIR